MPVTLHKGEHFEAWAIRTQPQSDLLSTFELGWAIRFRETMDGVRIHALADTSVTGDPCRFDSIEPVDAGEVLLVLFLEQGWTYYDPAALAKMPFPPEKPARLRMGLWVEDASGQLLLPRVDELVEPASLPLPPEGRRV